jgi:hypothetical protein
MKSTSGDSCNFLAIRSVTSSCTCRAVAPGQKVLTTITLKVNGGSSDCASLPYDSTPNRVTNASKNTTSD